MLSTVVRQDANSILPACRPKPAHVRFKRLPDSLVVIQPAHLVADVLHDPDRRGVGCARCAADVPDRVDLLHALAREERHAVLTARLLQQFGVIRADKAAQVVAFPDMVVDHRVKRQLLLLAKLLKRWRKVGIVAPV